MIYFSPVVYTLQNVHISLLYLLLTNPIRSWHWMLYKPFTPFAKELMTERQVHKNLKDLFVSGQTKPFMHVCILYRK